MSCRGNDIDCRWSNVFSGYSFQCKSAFCFLYFLSFLVSHVDTFLFVVITVSN